MITVSIACAFNANTSITASATIELEAGLPVSTDARAIPADPWISCYPG